MGFRTFVIGGILLGLAACDGAGGPLANDEARIDAEPGEGTLTLTGVAGVDVTDDKIRNLLIEPDCQAAGLRLRNLSITRGAGGVAQISALCA